MQKKLIGYLIIIVALLILIGIIYVIFFHRFSAPAAVDNTKPQAQNNIEKIPEVIKIAEEKKVEANTAIKRSEPVDPTEVSIKKLATSFAERYGTYSNQSNFANLEESLLFMSEKMKAREKKNLEILRSKTNDYKSYNAVVTKVATCQITHQNTDIAEAAIGAIKTEFYAKDSEKKSYQQSAVVKLIKESGEWKVDEFVWE